MTIAIYLLHVQIADAVELMLLSVLSPSVKCQWGLSTFEQALITTVSSYVIQHVQYVDVHMYMYMCTTALHVHVHVHVHVPVLTCTCTCILYLKCLQCCSFIAKSNTCMCTTICGSLRLYFYETCICTHVYIFTLLVSEHIF